MRTVECPSCDGRGFHQVVFDDCDGQGQADECTTCEGSGLVAEAPVVPLLAALQRAVDSARAARRDGAA